MGMAAKEQKAFFFFVKPLTSQSILSTVYKEKQIVEVHFLEHMRITSAVRRLWIRESITQWWNLACTFISMSLYWVQI